MMATAERTTFPEPSAPYPNDLIWHHSHDLTMVGATREPNGTWSSVWACSLCPDIFRGGKVGPVPAGFHGCGWVQREWPRDTCEDCGRPMTEGGAS